MASSALPSLLTALLPLALALYALALVAAWLGLRWGRSLLALGLVPHLAWMGWRGFAIGFFPLTSKAESFAAAAAAQAIVLMLVWRPQRAFVTPPLVVALAEGVAAALFPQELHHPVPLLLTVWYPLHVPLSFLAMGTWVAAAGAGLAYAGTRDRAWVPRIDQLALQGFGLWSASMIFGGIWGVVAWGAYFMWDPKVIWSVILWFHYAAFAHVRWTPSLQGRAWVRPVLAWLGFFWILIAYVGTSFFFGKSSHAF